MLTLYLLRHAKSSWDDASQQDFERPLNNRVRVIVSALTKPAVGLQGTLRRGPAFP